MPLADKFTLARFGAAAVSAAAILGLGLGVGAAGPEPAGDRMMLVLDSSGSMAERLEGSRHTKMEIARDVIERATARWAERHQMTGLVAYGHRSREQCSDVEQLVAWGEVDPAAYTTALAGMRPTGKTPLIGAIRLAAERLEFRDKPASVVLLTDGRENCVLDPCAEARALAQAGKALKVHVIGFDVDSETQSELRCIADATGGRYVGADSADGLLDALELVGAPREPEFTGKAHLLISDLRPGRYVLTITVDGMMRIEAPAASGAIAESVREPNFWVPSNAPADVEPRPVVADRAASVPAAEPSQRATIEPYQMPRMPKYGLPVTDRRGPLYREAMPIDDDTDAPVLRRGTIVTDRASDVASLDRYFTRRPDDQPIRRDTARSFDQAPVASSPAPSRVVGAATEPSYPVRPGFGRLVTDRPGGGSLAAADPMPDADRGNEVWRSGVPVTDRVGARGEGVLVTDRARDALERTRVVDQVERVGRRESGSSYDASGERLSARVPEFPTADPNTSRVEKPRIEKPARVAVGVTLEAPSSIVANEEFTIFWRGAGRGGDRIVLVPSDRASCREPDAMALGGQVVGEAYDGGRVTARAPRLAGRYAVLYCAENQRSPLARSILDVSEAASRATSLGEQAPARTSTSQSRNYDRSAERPAVVLLPSEPTVRDTGAARPSRSADRITPNRGDLPMVEGGRLTPRSFTSQEAPRWRETFDAQIEWLDDETHDGRQRLGEGQDAPRGATRDRAADQDTRVRPIGDDRDRTPGRRVDRTGDAPSVLVPIPLDPDDGTGRRLSRVDELEDEAPAAPLVVWDLPVRRPTSNRVAVTPLEGQQPHRDWGATRADVMPHDRRFEPGHDDDSDVVELDLDTEYAEMENPGGAGDRVTAAPEAADRMAELARELDEAPAGSYIRGRYGWYVPVTGDDDAKQSNGQQPAAGQGQVVELGADTGAGGTRDAAPPPALRGRYSWYEPVTEADVAREATASNAPGAFIDGRYGWYKPTTEAEVPDAEVWELAAIDRLRAEAARLRNEADSIESGNSGAMVPSSGSDLRSGTADAGRQPTTGGSTRLGQAANDPVVVVPDADRGREGAGAGAAGAQVTMADPAATTGGEPTRFENDSLDQQLSMLPPVSRTMVGPKFAMTEAVKAGHVFQVAWNSPVKRRDWIAVARASDPADSYLALKATRPEGNIDLRAPSAAGEYELRYISSDDGRVMSRQAFRVEAAEVRLVAMEYVEAGDEMRVWWMGPGHTSDRVTLASDGMSQTAYLASRPIIDGNPVLLEAPKDPGTYELRYINGTEGVIMYRTRLVVTARQTAVLQP